MKLLHKPVSLLFIGLTCCIATSSDLRAESVSNISDLPGDHFDLRGAMEMFKEAGSPEAFEKLLNTPNNKVNNLDLNNDGEVDYIRVIDKKDGDVHAFILQVPVSEAENQDVAVIELERTGSEKAIVQITGDEGIFGENIIVEPVEENPVTFQYNNQQPVHGPNAVYEADDASAIIINVWGWPFVQFVYRPTYTIWISPWSWVRRPVWWMSWRPVPRPIFYSRHTYYGGYAVVHTQRIPRAYHLYRPARVTSVTVINRYHSNNNHDRVGDYNYRTTPQPRRQGNAVREVPNYNRGAHNNRQYNNNDRGSSRQYIDNRRGNDNRNNNRQYNNSHHHSDSRNNNSSGNGRRPGR